MEGSTGSGLVAYIVPSPVTALPKRCMVGGVCHVPHVKRTALAMPLSTCTSTATEGTLRVHARTQKHSTMHVKVSHFIV